MGVKNFKLLHPNDGIDVYQDDDAQRNFTLWQRIDVLQDENQRLRESINQYIEQTTVSRDMIDESFIINIRRQQCHSITNTLNEQNVFTTLIIPSDDNDNNVIIKTFIKVVDN
jgi:hypothetical protein